MLLQPGIVLQRLGERSYEVRADSNDKVYRRNRVHLKPYVYNYESDDETNDELVDHNNGVNEEVVDPGENEHMNEQVIINEPVNFGENEPVNPRGPRDRKPPYWMKDYVAK